MVGELAVIADLIAADQASDAVRKHDAFERERIGTRAKAAAAGTEMAADIESGPIISLFRYCLGLQWRRLHDTSVAAAGPASASMPSTAVASAASALSHLGLRPGI